MIMIYVHEIEDVCLCLYVSANYFYSSVLEKKNEWVLEIQILITMI